MIATAIATFGCHSRKAPSGTNLGDGIGVGSGSNTGGAGGTGGGGGSPAVTQSPP